MDITHFESLYPPNSREKEIEKIFSYIREGNSCQLVALAGVGRSNLLGMLSFNRNVRIRHVGELHKVYHFVYLNFVEIKKKPLIEATKFIFLSLIDSLRDRKMDEEYEVAYKTFKESLGLNDELVLFQGLKRVVDLLALEHDLTIVLLFDRFEEYVPMLTSDFFTNLRILRNRAKYHFSAVFSLNRPLEEILEPTLFADYYEFLAGHVVYLPIADDPLLAFRIDYLEKTTGKTIDPKLKEQIFKLTARHGKLTRLCLEATLDSSSTIDVKARVARGIRQLADHGAHPPLAESTGGRKPGTGPAQDSHAILISFLLSQKPVRGVLFEIWRSFTPAEQKILAAGGQTNLFLENIGLFKEGKIQIPLLEAFIKQEFPASQLQAEHLTFDLNTHSITKGEMIISDTLTSSEYRLLRFLLTNPDRVIEREELINAVWQENKSTAGVTDQAVDQLIFRVRKKIELDLNNPTHLQTVKGRGFRFVA